MTPRERVQVAMDLGVPDRIPLMCQMSIGHMLSTLHVSPAEFWNDEQAFAAGLLALRERYDFDGILVSLHGHDPEWRREVSAVRKTAEGEEVTWKDGDVTFYPDNELPMHRRAQHFHTSVLNDLRPENLPPVLCYIPVSQGLRFHIAPGHEFDIFDRLRSGVGNRCSLHGEVTSPLDYYLDLVGLDEGLMGLIDNPETVEMVLSHFTTLIATLAVRMCDAGVDAIKLSSPFAGSGFLSRQYYSRFVLPFEATIAGAVRGKGVHIYTHTCGAIADRLELMLDAGVSGIECLDPPPLGNIELAEAKQRTRGKGFIKGNVDSVNTLLYGSRAEILADAQRRIQIGKEGGGFILSTACSIAPGVRPENVLLLREAVEKWGG